MDHESPATVGNTGLGQRRSVLKLLAALPCVGILVPTAAQSSTPALDAACDRQRVAYRALHYVLPGLFGQRQDNPRLPEMDLITSREGGIDLLVASVIGDWVWRIPLFSFAEIEDGSFKSEFYPKLKRIMERYT